MLGVKVTEREISYPSVERIDPILIPRTSKVDYVVVAGSYFNARQQAGVQQAVLDALRPGATVKVHAGGIRLSVYPSLSDSLGGNGSFAVLTALRDLLKPKKPHVAAGFVLLRAAVPSGQYVLGIRLLGNPSQETVKKVASNIQRLPSVKQLRWPPVKDSSFHFAIAVEGVWQAVADDFMLELRQAGTSLCITPLQAGW